jgi:hypothetical protein
MKKKTPQTTVVMPIVGGFDLSTTDKGVREVYAQYLESLTAQPGWMLLSTIMSENLKRLERIIITRRTEGSNEKLSEEDTEEYRIQHAQIEQTLNLPLKLIAEYRKKHNNAVVSYDPYAQSLDVQEERKRAMAGTLSD